MSESSGSIKTPDPSLDMGADDVAVGVPSNGDGSGHTFQPAPDPYAFRLPCRDCGPGYRIGDEGCRHGGYQPSEGETGVCRTCAKPIWWETGTVGHRERVGWSDRIERGGDSIVCFKSRDYRHTPMGGREAAIYEAGFNAGREATE